jgi:hypothetical protein
MSYSAIPGLIPELAMDNNSDVTMVFLEPGRVVFTTPARDPWYNATKYVATFVTLNTLANVTTNGSDAYMANEPSSPLACKSQIQFCNPNLPEDRRCGVLGSGMDAVNLENGYLGVFPENNDTISRLTWLLDNSISDLDSMDNMLRVLGSTSLLSRYGLGIDGRQSLIPDNQWQLDVEHWFSIVQASLQYSLVMAAIGPTDPEVRKWFRAPSDHVESSFCNNQVGGMSLVDDGALTASEEDPKHCIHFLQLILDAIHIRARKYHHSCVLHPRSTDGCGS